MQLSAKDAWKRILDEAQRHIEPHHFEAFLQPTEAIALDDGRLIVGAPDGFAVETNEQRHGDLLTRIAGEVLDRPTAVVFRVQEERLKRPQMDFFVAAAPSAAAPANPASTSP